MTEQYDDSKLSAENSDKGLKSFFKKNEKSEGPLDLDSSTVELSRRGVVDDTLGYVNTKPKRAKVSAYSKAVIPAGMSLALTAAMAFAFITPNNTELTAVPAPSTTSVVDSTPTTKPIKTSTSKNTRNQTKPREDLSKKEVGIPVFPVPANAAPLPTIQATPASKTAVGGEDVGERLIAANGRISWPTKKTTLSSPYGVRIDPFTKTARFHTGVDVADACGTILYAAEDGTVTAAGNTGGAYGIRVEITHNAELETMYSHLSKLLVKTGDKVKMGQKIGLMGTTGRSTGCHLHFEVGYKGKYVDPMPWLTGVAPRDNSSVPYNRNSSKSWGNNSNSSNNTNSNSNDSGAVAIPKTATSTVNTPTVTPTPALSSSPAPSPDPKPSVTEPVSSPAPSKKPEPSKEPQPSKEPSAPAPSPTKESEPVKEIPKSPEPTKEPEPVIEVKPIPTKEPVPEPTTPPAAKEPTPEPTTSSVPVVENTALEPTE